jgi:methionyl-tRNA synthetase
LESYDLQGGLLAAWKLVSAGNLAIDTHKPWDLAKDPEKAGELDGVLSEIVASLRQLAMLVYPYMPERAGAMAKALGIDEAASAWALDDFADAARAPRQVYKTEPLFPRLDAEEVIDGGT